MAYSAFAIANAFIEFSEKKHLSDLSPMKLQKLMFYAQSWHLKLHGSPLFDDFFSRWKYGPVIPTLYHEFKEFGARNINTRATFLRTEGGTVELIAPEVPDTDQKTHEFIQKIVKAYGGLDGAELSNLTHQPNTAWALKGGDGSVITPEEMLTGIENEIAVLKEQKKQREAIPDEPPEQ